MIVGETIRVRHVETQVDPITEEPALFRVMNNPTVAVTGPDGAVISPAPAVTIRDGSASDPESVSQIFSFLLTPVLGGTHTAVLSYQDEDGETITRRLNLFATWTDPAMLIQSRLQTTLPAEVLDGEFASVSRKLLSRFPCIGNPPNAAATSGNYYGLTDPGDQAYFDEATALAVCARLVGPLRTGGQASDIVQKRIGDVMTHYADQTRERIDERGSPGDYGAGPGGYSGTNERVRWLREAAEAMGRISCVSQAFLARRSSFSPFVINGLTRQQKAAGSAGTLLSTVIDLFTNDYFIEQDGL